MFQSVVSILATIYVGAVQERLPYGAPKASDVIAAREGYVVGFNNSTHNPDWCYERLTLDMLKGAKQKRTEDFRHDAQIPRSAELSDYKGSGWSRGHMVPAADMKWSMQAMSESFLLSNMIPQDPRNNSGAWNRLEQLIRNWADREKSLIVITGPIYDSDSVPRYIGSTKVRIPDYIFKVVMDETPPRKMIGFIAPNRDTKKRPVELAVTVDEVEEATGMDFFHGVEDESKMESELNIRGWGLVTTPQLRRVQSSHGVRGGAPAACPMTLCSP